jgi:hypothetical protein
VTINIAVATLDAVVLGCDSLSSVVQPMINPAKMQAALGADGTPLRDKDGNFSFVLTEMEQYPVNVFGGVSKMFCLYEDKDTSAAAVTSGQGTVNGRTIAALAGQFKRNCETAKPKKKTFKSVETIAKAFLDFMYQEWMAQPHMKGLPAGVQYPWTVNFIIGGFGKDDAYGRVFHLNVAQNSMHEQFATPPHSGVTWGGQANYVERLLRGADSRLEQLVSRNVLEALKSQRESVIESILKGLQEAGVEVPDGLNFKFTEVIPPADPWQKFWAEIDYPNLPVQYAVDLASLLVNIQSGMQHFGTGIATVGGRTHVGVLQRNIPFKKLKEPKLAHSHTGYSHEL